MDINQLRAAVTLLGLATFVGIALWAWSRRRSAAFDEAAQLPFLDDETTEQAGARQ
jgi:cytochrome c oxidase cbb3-type subunit IV